MQASTASPASATVTKQPIPSNTNKVSSSDTCVGLDYSTGLVALFNNCGSSSMLCEPSKDYSSTRCQVMFGKHRKGRDRICPNKTCGKSKKEKVKGVAV